MKFSDFFVNTFKNNFMKQLMKFRGDPRNNSQSRIINSNDATAAAQQPIGAKDTMPDGNIKV